MELSHSALVGFRTRYETIFNQAFALAEPKIDKIALVFNSGRVELVNHRWMRGIPQMREFTDSRIFNNVSTDGFTVQNKLWEDTISIQRVDLERDQWGVYSPMVAKLGQTAKLHRDSLGFGLLSSALSNTSITAYDGIAFYGNHNANRSVAFNNKATGGGSALSETSLITGLTALRNRRDSHGQLLAATSSRPLLIVPPALEFTAKKLANLSFIVSTQPGTGASSASSQASMSENILQGSFDIEVCPYLATSTEWHLTLVDSLFKPIIFQVEQEVEFLGPEKFPTRWAEQDEFCMGVRALYNAAVGLPDMVYGAVGA